VDESTKPRFLLFKTSIAAGLLLGLLLLVQTVSTYRYVANNMVRQEAQREADRKAQSVQRAARPLHGHDSAPLQPVVDELHKESGQQIAWVRVIGQNGAVIAQSGQAEDNRLYTRESLRAMLQNPDPRNHQMLARSGDILVTVSPLRIGPPPGMGAVEIGTVLAGISTNFGPLRRNLIIGCSAAFALLMAVIVIGLRSRHYARGKRIEEELAMARRVQFAMLPAGRLQTRHVDFAGQCIPAWQVGGDLYDVFENEKRQTALVLGDVSGKGVSAALLMGVVQGAIHASGGDDPSANLELSVERLNRLLCAKTSRERFVSLFWGWFDPSRAVLTYVNAGHLPPMLIRGHKVHRLETGGPVLGLLDGAPYVGEQVEVHAGDLLVVFSDGILEAVNRSGEEFGEEQILAAARANENGSPEEIRDAILNAVRAFLGQERPQDDQTLMVVRLQPVTARGNSPSFQAEEVFV
jgi:sigma-B regulation protein RsbU (phosphoserine phosphatase)